MLLDADRLAAADEPVQQSGSRRARMLGAAGAGSDGADAAPAAASPAPAAKPAAGSTLFERMANLSRAATDRGGDGDEDDDDDDSGSVRIPRFLNRQNNQ